MGSQNSSSAKSDDDPLLPLWQLIWARRPILGDIMRKHGARNLYDYTRDFFDVNPSPMLDARKPELIQIVQDLLEERLGKKVAEEVARQLKKLPLVSTTDHHNPVAHPFFLNSNIVSGIPYMETEDLDLKYLVVFSFASLSLNNDSGYSRGLVFHGGYNGDGPLIKLNIFSDKEKMAVIYGYRAFTTEDLDRAAASLDFKVKEGTLNPEKAKEVKGLLDTYFRAPEVLAAPDLCTQITKLDLLMWPRLFHPVQEKVPDLIYLDIETLVREVFLRVHLNKPESFLYRMLFDESWRPLINKYFNNVPGAFSLEKDWGTFLFWALDEKNHRIRLKLDGKTLKSTDGQFEFELTPECIEKALRERKIFPAMFLCYFVVALYYGMKCLGGFCQVNDLTKTKQVWQEMLRELGYNDEAEALVPLQTKELGGDGMLLAYVKNSNNDLVAPFGIDMILDKGSSRFEDYVEHTKILTFKEMMDPMVLEIYKVLFSFDERNPDYNIYTTDKILEVTGLKEKLLDWSCLDD